MSSKGALGNQDFLSGMMFIAFGTAGLYFGAEYEMGTAARMGPGYFPTLISSLLLLAGLVIGAQALWSGSVRVEWGTPRPFLGVIAAILAFTMLIGPAGFAAATFMLILLVYLGGWQPRWLEMAVLYAILLTGSFLLFAKVLMMPLEMVPGG